MELAIVILILVAAAAYLLARALRKVRPAASAKAGCGGCTDCAAPSPHDHCGGADGADRLVSLESEPRR